MSVSPFRGQRRQAAGRPSSNSRSSVTAPAAPVGTVTESDPYRTAQRKATSTSAPARSAHTNAAHSRSPAPVVSTAFISKPGARTSSPFANAIAPSAPSVTTAISASAPSCSAASSGVDAPVISSDSRRLTNSDAGAVEVARRVAGEGAGVVVAAGRVAARARRHEVELVERGDDAARLEGGHGRSARGRARLVGDHRALAAPRHHDRGRRARAAGADRELDALALERLADEAALEVLAERHRERRAEPEPGGADRVDGAAAGRAQEVAGEALLPRARAPTRGR